MRTGKPKLRNTDGAEDASSDGVETGTGDAVPRTRHRSPNYPNFNLEIALTKARNFANQIKRSTVDMDTAVHVIGYKPKTAGGGRGIATMLAYDLLEEVRSGAGARQFKLSQSAYRILVVLTENDPEYLDMLQSAAIKPKVYADILNRFPQPPLPPDSAIRRFLLDDLNFNADVVADVIKDFKATYEFAKLDERGTLSEENSDIDHDSDDHLDSGIKKPVIKGKGASGSGGKGMTGQQQVATSTFAIPMMNGREIMLQSPDRLEPEDKPYIELLESYVRLLKQKAMQPAEASEGEDQE